MLAEYTDEAENCGNTYKPSFRTSLRIIPCILMFDIARISIKFKEDTIIFIKL